MKRSFPKNILLLSFLTWLFSLPTLAGPPKEMVLTVLFDTSARTDGALAYSRKRPLTYRDFKGPVPDGVPLGNVAQTVAVIGYQMKSRTVGNRTEAIVTLSLVMAPNVSWMKIAGRTPDVLRHEQLHFDIAAIHACLLRDQITNAVFRPETLKEQLRVIYQEANRATAEEQARYDVETLHGIDRDEQARWEMDIAERMHQVVCF